MSHKTVMLSINRTLAIAFLGILIIAIGAMSIVLKAEVASLKSEITELKSFRSEIFSVDFKTKISQIESKVEETSKDEQTFLNNIAKVRNDVEELKAVLAKREKEEVRPARRSRSGKNGLDKG